MPLDRQKHQEEAEKGRWEMVRDYLQFDRGMHVTKKLKKMQKRQMEVDVGENMKT